MVEFTRCLVAYFRGNMCPHWNAAVRDGFQAWLAAWLA
jgi:hypothetical protein